MSGNLLEFNINNYVYVDIKDKYKDKMHNACKVTHTCEGGINKEFYKIQLWELIGLFAGKMQYPSFDVPYTCIFLDLEDITKIKPL